VSIGVIVTIAAVASLIVTQTIDFAVYDLRIAALDSDVHASIFGVVSLVAQGAAIAAAVARARTSRHRKAWSLLAVLLSALLVVRIVASYSVLLVPPVALVCAMLWKLTADDEPRARAVVRVALMLLAFSFVVHGVGPKVVTALGYSANSWPYEVKALLKHTTEMAGWMLLASGLFAGRAPRPARKGADEGSFPPPERRRIPAPTPSR
jgi:uncharacterized membrane protein YfbV (UPF0208 family)